MNRKGVAYDVGTRWGLGVSSRPRSSEEIVRHEFEIIHPGLHCTAVKVGRYDPDRIAKAASCALEQRLEVWSSPTLFDQGRDAAAHHGGRPGRGKGSAAVERKTGLLRRTGADALQGWDLARRTFLERLHHPALPGVVRAGKHGPALNTFLAEASATTRSVFQGPVAYAALPFEGVDWGPFDLVGVDHYWDERIEDQYVEMLHPFFATGKPVVVTGTGSRAYQGAHTSGTLGLGVVDPRSRFWHGLPVLGRFVRPHLKKGTCPRDEGAQARRLASVLELLDRAGVDGDFIDTFVDGPSPYSEEAHYDLDMSVLSLVKTYEHGHGSTYPEMSWEPKEAFRAVAAYYAR